MAGQSKPLCLAGRQNMAGMYTKAFYCDDRRTGNEILIRQVSSKKTISICEVAVLSEAKRKCGLLFYHNNNNHNNSKNNEQHQQQQQQQQ